MNHPVLAMLLVAVLGGWASFLLMLLAYGLGLYPECVHLTYSTCF